jgi:hypothetical protein
MPSCISYRDQYFWVSNTRLKAQFEHVVEVAERTAKTEDERRLIERFRVVLDSVCPGTRIQLEQLFETIEEKKYWTTRFIELAHTIFDRNIGALSAITGWGPSAISDAYFTARFLVAAIRETEPEWSPPVKDWDEFVNKPLNVQLS